MLVRDVACSGLGGPGVLPVAPRARQLEVALAAGDHHLVGVVHVHVDDGGRLADPHHLAAPDVLAAERHPVQVVDLEAHRGRAGPDHRQQRHARDVVDEQRDVATVHVADRVAPVVGRRPRDLAAPVGHRRVAHVPGSVGMRSVDHAGHPTRERVSRARGVLVAREAVGVEVAQLVDALEHVGGRERELVVGRGRRRARRAPPTTPASTRRARRWRAASTRTPWSCGGRSGSSRRTRARRAAPSPSSP